MIHIKEIIRRRVEEFNRYRKWNPHSNGYDQMKRNAEICEKYGSIPGVAITTMEIQEGRKFSPQYLLHQIQKLNIDRELSRRYRAVFTTNYITMKPKFHHRELIDGATVTRKFLAHERAYKLRLIIRHADHRARLKMIKSLIETYGTKRNTKS